MPLRGYGCQHTESMLYSRQILSVMSIANPDTLEPKFYHFAQDFNAKCLIYTKILK